MADLDSMTNDELRVELQRYGFQNIPLTQTTRKVLIKKLRVAIETQKNQTRRNTIAVTKASDDDDIPLAEILRAKKEKTPNRRATVAVAEKSKSVTKTQNGEGNSKSPSRRSSRATPSQERPNYALQDQSDDDIIEIIDVPVTRRSKSKTPTLSKSETVRTSHYTARSSKERIIPVVREEDVSTEEDDKSPEIEFQAPRPVVTRRTINTLSYNNKPSTFASRTSTISTSYNPSGTYTTFNNAADDEEDDYEEDINAPYLSNFAKRLSTLRADPLDSGINKYKKDLGYDKNAPSTSTYRYSSSSNYSKPARAESGVMTGISNKYDKLDRKYSITKFVYFMFFIMIVVAVYVIFFT
jgi:phage shock protein PspC (stress-responsive transcriptional regulator)